MNKNLLQVALFLLLSQIINAQTIDQIKNNRETYIWGEGVGPTLNRADQVALAMLTNQISTQVESNFTLLQEEVASSGSSSFNETFKGVINTYSNATLQNTERIVISNEPDAKIFRYIKREDVTKIFADRETKILDFAKNAENAINELRVADALRYYYWSLTLLRSHPNANTIALDQNNGEKRLLITTLPERIDYIFDNIKIENFTSRIQDGLICHTLKITYKNNSVQNFDFSYWTGKDWSNIHSAKDGYGAIEFTTNQAIDDIRIKAEYIFDGETAVDNELRDVMSKLEVIPFRKSYFSISTKQTEPENQVELEPETELESKPETVPINVAEQQATSNSRNLLATVENPEPYAERMDEIVKAISTCNLNYARENFTDEGFDMFSKLLGYGQAKIIMEPDFKYLQFGDGVMCRALKMNFNFANNNRNFVEDVVFQFNSEKQVQSITFGLNQTALSDIIDIENWSETERLILINFLESYKTAYALKRLDYIESLFADDALIIVGSILKVKNSGDTPYVDNQIVKYNRFTKEQFIKHLKHSFASKEFINIRFENNTVRKSGKGGEVFGIQIKQDYYSSNYGDSGYLFLLVDINEPSQPIIHVRTWQPEKNSDGSIYGLGDF